MNDVKTLISSNFPAVEASKHSNALPRTSYISKNFVTYIEALVGATPFCKTADNEEQAARAFTKGFQGAYCSSNSPTSSGAG